MITSKPDWVCPFCPKGKALSLHLRNEWGSLLDTRLAQMQAHLLQHLVAEVKLLTAKSPKRPATAYQTFVGRQMKKGMTIQEAAATWRGRQLATSYLDSAAGK